MEVGTGWVSTKGATSVLPTDFPSILVLCLLSSARHGVMERWGE